MTVDPRGLRPSAQLPAAHPSPRSTAPPIRASMTSAASAPSASCRPSTTCVFLGASVSRYPLEGYREKCATDVTLGTRFAKKPIELKIPITIAGMSFGALGANAKEAHRPRRHRDGHQHHHRRRRHDARRSASPRRPWSIRCCPRATA